MSGAAESGSHEEPGESESPSGPDAGAEQSSEHVDKNSDQRAVGVLATLAGLPNMVRFLLAGIFVNQLGAFLRAFMVLYLVHRGFSNSQAGTALALYGAGSVIGLLFGGGLADRLGARLTIVWAMLTSAALVVSVSALRSYPVILVAVFLAGATAQSYRPAASTMLAKATTKDRQTMVFALNRMAVNLGALGGPLLAAWLIAVSWDLMFWLDGATSVAYAVIAYLKLPREDAETRAMGAARSDRIGYVAVLKDRRYSFYLFMVFANAVVYIQMMTVLPLSIKAAGHPTVVYSVLNSLSAGMIIGLELLITRFVQHWAPRTAISVGFGLLGIGLVGFGLPGGVPTLVAAMVVGTTGEMIGGPSVFAWPARVAPAAATGRYLGAMQSAFGLGQAVGPVLGVAVWNAGHRQLWVWCGVVAALCVIAGQLGMRENTAAEQTAAQTEPVPA
ncbi:MAG: MFS transporter [Catenulispora sp.]|nr:MFS transporter [Catenulispora sp.]